jgi:hypothetical protein
VVELRQQLVDRDVEDHHLEVGVGLEPRGDDLRVLREDGAHHVDPDALRRRERRRVCDRVDGRLLRALVLDVGPGSEGVDHVREGDLLDALGRLGLRGPLGEPVLAAHGRRGLRHARNGRLAHLLDPGAAAARRLARVARRLQPLLDEAAAQLVRPTAAQVVRGGVVLLLRLRLLAGMG